MPFSPFTFPTLLRPDGGGTLVTAAEAEAEHDNF